MCSLIAGIEGVESFLDDFIVHTKTKADHDEKNSAILYSLDFNNLHSLRLEKCQFRQTSIKFIDHIVDPAGIRLDPAKNNAIVQTPWSC